jgi:hypothetical protein
MLFPAGSDLITMLLSKQNVALLLFPGMLFVGAERLGQDGVSVGDSLRSSSAEDLRF